MYVYTYMCMYLYIHTIHIISISDRILFEQSMSPCPIHSSSLVQKKTPPPAADAPGQQSAKLSSAARCCRPVRRRGPPGTWPRLCNAKCWVKMLGEARKITGLRQANSLLCSRKIGISPNKKIGYFAKKMQVLRNGKRRSLPLA